MNKSILLLLVPLIIVFCSSCSIISEVPQDEEVNYEDCNSFYDNHINLDKSLFMDLSPNEYVVSLIGGTRSSLEWKKIFECEQKSRTNNSINRGFFAFTSFFKKSLSTYLIEYNLENLNNFCDKIDYCDYTFDDESILFDFQKMDFTEMNFVPEQSESYSFNNTDYVGFSESYPKYEVVKFFLIYTFFKNEIYFAMKETDMMEYFDLEGFCSDASKKSTSFSYYNGDNLEIKKYVADAFRVLSGMNCNNMVGDLIYVVHLCELANADAGFKTFSKEDICLTLGQNL
jgi:hypothetical protein